MLARVTEYDFNTEQFIIVTHAINCSMTNTKNMKEKNTALSYSIAINTYFLIKIMISCLLLDKAQYKICF